MVRLWNTGAYLQNSSVLTPDNGDGRAKLSAQGFAADEAAREEARKGTMAYQILMAHNQSGNEENLQIRFDKLTSHDITFVGIIQTARASGLTEFPVPYVLTNCHNSLCAVGGTINEDDHMFGLSCARKYGGIYVPPHMAVIHQFAREMLAGCGEMILGSDSHTRYGALGTMAIGEGGPELVKQLLKRTYDIRRPQVVAVYLTGAPQKGVGPQDIALAIIGAVFKSGYVNNKVLEFVGPGVANLSVDMRIGVDVMTTETTCLSSIWTTDGAVKDFYAIHGRPESYKELAPASCAYYDGVVEVALDQVKPMIAMPFHPSNTYTIEEVNANAADILREVEKAAEKTLGGQVKFCLTDKLKNGRLFVDQGVIAGCAGGGYENLCDAADILRGRDIGDGAFSLSVYPASQPVMMQLVKNGVMADFIAAGATVRTAFCGPCFGAGDVPCNNGFSIRHSTRNFPNREGSKPGNGQIASVALMDARSIAATAANHGMLTAATDVDVTFTKPAYFFDKTIYEKRVYNGAGHPIPEEELRLGPNIKDWPAMVSLTENLLLKVVSEIHDPVTTTDELIPSGETSSYRSNPLGLAEFTLSRRDPAYVGEAKAVQAMEKVRESGEHLCHVYPDMKPVMGQVKELFPDVCMKNTGIGSTIFAVKPGDGSAREQAASCQKVLGGWANIANEYATKRYRSNLINWGMLPLRIKEGELPFSKGDFLFLPDIRKAVEEGRSELRAFVVSRDMKEITLLLDSLTEDEKKIILAGCLINFYKG
ncbi:MAG: hydratase [Lachnospiraceae bacterium]|nr:hydratase [Lachnospiraceae bacterium]